MSLNPEDPRVKKTRRAMREAFIRLLLQKGYDATTIQDIASEAETARITFYRHYKDKEELLTDCLDELYKDLVEKTEQEIEAGAQVSHAPTRIFYEHLEEQEQLYRVLFSSLGTQSVMGRMKGYMAKRVMEELDAFGTNLKLGIPDEITAIHMVSAQIGVGIWWLGQGKPYPLDYMVQTSVWLSFMGVLRSLGIEGTEMTPPELPMDGGS